MALGLQVAWWELIARSVVIYLCLIVGLRVFGKREVGQFTIFDLVFVLLVANAVQPAMTGPDTSLLGGVIIIAVLLIVNRGISYLRRIEWLRPLLESQPTVIARDGRWNQDAMRREGLDVDDCEMTLREHGLSGVEEAEEVVLESDGNISVVPKPGAASQTAQSRRRVRFVKRR